MIFILSASLCYNNVMDEVKRIRDYLENTEKTLVFTSETAARNAISAYIESNPGKAVFRDRALSWDRFYLSLLDTGGKRNVTKTERKLFAYSFLKNGGLGSLRYFASSAYPESTLAYSSSIASLLPYFPSSDDPIREHMPGEMLSDIDILRPSYEEFLSERGLYEKNYLIPDYSKIGKDSFVFVFPTTFTSSKVYDILSLGVVDVIDAPTGGDTPLVDYTNSLSEIRWTLRGIEKDRKTYRDDEIAITSSSLDSYRPYLESEAKKRDIPLVFTSSRPLSDYAEGRFLHQVYSAVMSSWSFDETKKLLLNPQFPFRERERLVGVIRQGIERKMEDRGLTSWLRVLNSSDREFFRSLTATATGIVRSKKPALVIKHIQEFRDEYFEPGEWTETEDRVFGSAIEILEGMGDVEITDLYKLFLSLVDETQYVERTDDESGIRVYAYPASAGLITPVHYVIGLDDRTTAKKIDDYPYLVSLERPELRDISSAILETYRSKEFAQKLVLSGTTEGFDGARLLPPLFLDSSVRHTGDIEDGYEEEHSLWISSTPPENSPYLSQAKGYERARNTSLKGRNEIVSVLPFTDEKISISVSNMKNYDLCPYRGYAATRLGIKDRDYEPKTEDPRIIGEILHETIEESLKEAEAIANIDIERMMARFEDKLKEAYDKKKIPVRYSFEHIRGQFIDTFECLQESSKACFYKGYLLKENEKKINDWPLTGAITVNGRVDTILLNNETGDAYIIDWKTTGKSDYSSDLTEISLQVILYAVLLEDDKSLLVKGGAFYSFSEGNYKVIWPPVEYTSSNNRKYKEGFDVTLLKTEINDRLDNIRTSLEDGDFTPVVTEHSCTFCPYARLCRAKFVASKEKNND